MKTLITLFLIGLVAFSNVNGQWIQSENLLGGSIVNDAIEYKGSLYIAMNGHGVFKSNDNGNSWNQVEYSGYWSYGVFTIHNDQLLACTSGTLYKTSDGENWTEEDVPGIFVNDIHSDDTTIVIATIKGVFKSEDEGATWIDVNNEETAIYMLSVAITGSTIWAGGHNGALFKSTTAGQTWNKIDISATYSVSQIIAFEENLYINIGYGGLLKSTDNGESWNNITGSENSISFVNKVYVEDTSIFLLGHSSIYLSDDRGESWTRKGQKITSFSLTSMLVTQNNVYLGSWGGGIFVNNRAVDKLWESKNSGIRLIATNDILVENNTVFLGTDLSFVRSSKDEGESWEQKVNRYGSSVSRVWSMLSSDDYIFAGLAGGGVQRSHDSGATWEVVNNGLANTNIIGLAANEKFIFAGTDGGFFRSEDFGNHWIDKTDGITSNLRTVHTHDSYVLAGTWNGLFISEDNGDTWNKISTGLPDESIGNMLFMDSVLFAATQYNGLYKTSDLGLHWEKVNDNSVFSLARRNEYIFMGSRNGRIFASQDMGETWTDIGDQLPDALVSAINFTDNYLITGTIQSGFGIWKRPLHELVPPALSFYSSESDSTFVIGKPIYIESDQELRNPDGSMIDAVALSSLISIKNSQYQEVSFSAQINANNKLIELMIDGAEEDVYHTITVDSVRNLSGLSNTISHSKLFKARKNNLPVLTDIFISSEADGKITFNSSDFIQAFADLDSDTLVKIMIKSIPEHGTLKFKNKDVSINDEFLKEEVKQLVYTPKEGFSGSDQFTWNGFDGIEYALSDAKLELDITTVTGISDHIHTSYDLLYPNPVIENLTMTLDNDITGTYHVQILHVSGRVIKNYTFTKSSNKEEIKISLLEIPKGIYIINITSSKFQVQKKFIKK